MSDTLKVERRGALTVLTFSRPQVLNSFNRELAKALQAALQQARDDRSVRALLLTGEGRAFSAGQDLAEVTAPEMRERDLAETVRDSYNPIIKALRGMEKPVVAAVNGIAAGAGANIALACDIVVAARSASFVQAFSKIGLIPDSGGTFILPRLVGLARATAWTMLAEKISAEDAVTQGLIYRVVDDADLMTEALTIGERLAALPTRGLALTKQALNASFDNTLTQQLDLEEALQSEAGRTHDYREGVAAFLEKRRPIFRGE